MVLAIYYKFVISQSADYSINYQIICSIMWKQQHIGLEQLNAQCLNTMAEALDMRFVEIGEDYIKASMPVDKRTHQPYGLLHGGASAALAETVGSVASWLCIDPESQICVGMEINCNHLKAKRNGLVYATARAFHLGKTTHVWDIRITDEQENLVCVSRLTVAVRGRTQ
jgi:1,4-dihydroxy-2-naphthoyl-CoA hydrolase